MPRSPHAAPRRLVHGLALGAVLAVAFGCSSPAPRSASAFCTRYVAAATRGAAVAQGAASSLADLRREVATLTTDAHDAVDRAPNDVRSDAEALLAPLDALQASLDKATTRAQANQAIKVYATSTATLVEHQQRVNAWTKAHCKVEPVPTAGTTAPLDVAPTGPTG